IYGVDVMVNHNRSNVQGGWGIGDSNSRKLMHELLHAIGLDHPGPYNGDTANYESQALFFQDSHQYTVMSYWDAANSGAQHVAAGKLQWNSTPLLYDVAALQSLYGANMTTRTGDTVYGFNNTSGQAAYDLARDPTSIFTIWDAGGTDTLDLSGYLTPSRIDLGQGAFSDSAGMTQNISIAFGAIIENAIGGSGNDSLTGNAARNRLEGNAGADVLQGDANSDWLVGGAGGDTFVYKSYSDSDLPLLRSDGKKVASDYLADFTSGIDKIDLSALDANPATAANDMFGFIGAGAFGGVAGQLRFEVRNGQLWLEGDIDGDALTDFTIAMKAETLAAADLIL
ncbi:MAG TPA: M10 family metallopeptidase C-terminal domain-containing protein, partial [Allosphingosinicella sp.]